VHHGASTTAGGLQSAAVRHGPVVDTETVGVAPGVAEPPAPRSPDPQPLLAVATAVAAVAALLAIGLRRARASAARYVGTSSWTTRGPPALQPA
jgi:hypothetical protein